MLTLIIVGLVSYGVGSATQAFLFPCVMKKVNTRKANIQRAKTRAANRAAKSNVHHL